MGIIISYTHRVRSIVSIDCDHLKNLHSISGPRAELPVLLAGKKVASLLDVGCGTGTWLKAALSLGIPDVLGVDGIKIPPDQLNVSVDRIRHQDLTRPWNLTRKFDAVLCLEVAEHLNSEFAPILIDALVMHSTQIHFSAACPGQTGQHHVNCQWPAYWQQLFNDRGFVCNDAVRWRIWEMEAVEPWYRQNVFTARRAPEEAGKEPRIPAVLHPEMMHWLKSSTAGGSFGEHVEQIQNGRMPLGWYLGVPLRALLAKSKRKLR